jgi:hypothetical protein
MNNTTYKLSTLRSKKDTLSADVHQDAAVAL